MHQTNSPAANVEWLTPPALIAALGKFDLDPCTPDTMPWQTAAHRYTRGLRQPWFGRCWVNPPYGPYAAAWLRKLREHGNGIALVPARTETRMLFESVWGHAAGVCFLRGRPRFHHPDGAMSKRSIPAPVCLIAYGKRNLSALHRCGLGVVTTVAKPNK